MKMNGGDLFEVSKIRSIFLDVDGGNRDLCNGQRS